MASRIKGITVEIGGDTTGLDKALRSVNSSIKTTQSALKDVNKLLKLDPSNTELLTQKQKLLKDAVSSTKEKLDALKQAQEQAKQQLESGNLGQDKYDALHIPYFAIKFFLIVVLIPIIHWLLKDAQKGADIILSIITMILPWLIKRED